MLNQYDDSKQPDILEVISDLSNDEVFTPPKIVRQVLDLLPVEVWSDKNLRFIDPFTKTGVFLREITKRLNAGLTQQIPDSKARLDHILKNQVFGVAITELTSLISRRTVYCSKHANGEHSIVKMASEQGNVRFTRIEHEFEKGRCKDCPATNVTHGRGPEYENYAYPLLHKEGREYIEQELGLKFDVVVGNPPYQLKSGGEGTNSPPIYQDFVDLAFKLEPQYMTLIIPSRWMNGGMGLSGFRKMMLESNKLEYIVDYAKMEKVFPGSVDFEGGVQYFLWNKTYNGPANVTYVPDEDKLPSTVRQLDEFDVYIRDPRAVPLVRKVLSKATTYLESQISGVSPFGLATNFASHRLDKFEKSDLKLHLYLGGKRTTRYISRSEVHKNTALMDSWKVILPEAYGERGAIPAMVLGPTLISGPGEVCTHTYLTAGSFASNLQAQNLQAYLRTKFVRFLVWTRKSTQHTNRSHFTWVPSVSMDLTWTDEMLFREFGFSRKEIEYVNSVIREVN